MSFRPTSDQDRAALKAAFRRLLRTCGGQESAAEATRVGQPALSRYGSASHEIDHAPVDVVMDLTIDADNPVVLKEMCRIAHGVFMPLPEARVETATLEELKIAQALFRISEVQMALTRALAQGTAPTDAVPDISAAIDALCKVRGQITHTPDREAAE